MALKLPETATLKFTAQSKWTNWHKTVSQACVGIYDIYNDPNAQAANLAGLKATAATIQRAIHEVKAKGLRVRAIGSGWSLSPAPTTDGVMLNLSNLNWAMTVNPAALHPDVGGEGAAGIFLIQGGRNVSEVNAYVEARGRSLRTTGAANGQAFVGAASTCTHGSALGFGPLPDHIIGIHLIAGENKSWWLERASRPVMADAFAAAIGAELKRDDALFNAALVSLGGLGVIHAVAIETAPRFLLKSDSHVVAPITQELREVIHTLDFTKAPALFPDGKPYFLQVIVNPHKAEPEAYVTTMYRQPCPPDYQPHYELEGGIKPGYDVLSLVGSIADAIPAVTPLLAGAAAKTLMEAKTQTGTWGEIFTYKSPQAKVVSGSICVPLDRALEALDLLVSTIRGDAAVPLVFSCRFVQPSKALLAFTRHQPMNCVINIDGVFSKRSVAFMAKAADVIEAAGIPFTQHWGKAFAYTPARLQQAYGADLAQWKAARAVLMPDAGDRAAFTNPMMEQLGLG